ncbi:MAG: hypothetical protein CMB80_21095 [Flammeovirgaceae bacterium]|nr:hypothetical protein [Flammeovirgaceae bacterium]MBE62833.1 hypothetical protein [Flammeovirgaceae bacterium]MBR06820.1 hypothetical protein [Rickettsiales bacterium]HCX22708.1 hypothetical protein [Cytophagales bacterium]
MSIQDLLQHSKLMNLKHTTLITSIILIFGCNPAEKATNIIFQDDFNSKGSYNDELIQNATTKEYGENALANGHLLKNWNYSWDYSYDGDWKQAFYVVPEGKDYMEQAGRSAHFGNYRIIANTPIPVTTKHYTVEFRQWKNDNDPVFFLLGSDAYGDGGIRFGYENQPPGTDQTVDTVYTRGALGSHKIAGNTHFRQWANHQIDVNLTNKTITWTVEGVELLKGVIDDLPTGGHFGLLQHYERGTRYDDFVIKTID